MGYKFIRDEVINVTFGESAGGDSGYKDGKDIGKKARNVLCVYTAILFCHI